MKNSYNPYCVECSFDKFTDTTPLMVFFLHHDGYSAEYFANPYRYMDEIMLEINASGVGKSAKRARQWSYECLPAKSNISAAVPEAIIVAHPTGEKFKHTSIDKALRYVAKNLEHNEDYSVPSVYFLTDNDFAAELRQAIESKNVALCGQFNAIIKYAVTEHQNNFKFPKTLKLYRANIKSLDNSTDEREKI